MITTRQVVTTTTTHREPPPIVPVVYQTYRSSAPPLAAPQSSPTHQNTGSLSHSPSISNEKIANFQIALENDNSNLPNVYFTGDRLRGEVQLEIRRGKSLRALHVKFLCIGISKLGLTTKTLFKEEVSLFGSEKNKTHETISEGLHKYPISIDLPSNLKPSADSDGYYIKYICKAVIVRFFNSNKIEIERPIDIYQDNSNVNESLIEQQMPVNCDCTSGPLTISYTLNKTGFVLGEKPQIEGEIHNSDKHSVTAKIELSCVWEVKLLGVTNLSGSSSRTIQGAGNWTLPITVAGNSIENFMLCVAMGYPSPTSSCDQVEITHTLQLTVIRVKTKKLSLVTPKPKIQKHPIVVGRRLPEKSMKRSASGMSLRRSSTMKKAAPQRPSNSYSYTHNDSGLSQSSLDKPRYDQLYEPPPPYVE